MEHEILATISTEIGQKATRGNSLSYLGIDTFSKRSKLANAINERFNLTISESDISTVSTIGQLVDIILPLLESQSISKGYTQSESISDTQSESISVTQSESISETSSNSNDNPIME